MDEKNVTRGKSCTIETRKSKVPVFKTTVGIEKRKNVVHSFESGIGLRRKSFRYILDRRRMGDVPRFGSKGPKKVGGSTRSTKMKTGDIR